MLNKNKLLGKMAEAGYTQRKLALAAKISKSTLNAKINGKRYFNTEEIRSICRALNITSDSEKIDIFLPESSHKWVNDNE